MKKKVDFSEIKTRLFIYRALLLSVILTTLCLSVSVNVKVKHLEEKILSPSIEASIAMNEKFILREYEGRIGIFVAGEKEPLEVLNVFVFTLPTTDRAALKIGITVYGADALRTLIEDFTA